VHYWIPGAVAATLLLSGCSLWPAAEKTAVNEQRIAELQIPAGLKAPKKPGQYDLPAKVAAGVAPEQMDLRAPMQVLAVATNARVEEEEKEARVWFERSEFTGDLLPYLQNNINGYFSKNTIEVSQPKQLEWQTGWVSEYQETGWWLWKGQELTQQSKFSVQLEPRSHGRTVAVQVRLLEHKYTDDTQKLTPISQRREEVHFLNRIIDHIATVELAAIREAKAKLPDVLLTRAVNEKQEPVMLTTQPIDVAWSQLELVLEKVGLEVTDLNQSDYVYYVKYVKAEQGFWDSIWGDEDLPELPLTAGEYQLSLSKTDKGTAIKIKDKDGKVLDQTTLDAVYEVFAAAIRQGKLEL
jgi:uncharacterized lipoprotein